MAPLSEKADKTGRAGASRSFDGKDSMAYRWRGAVRCDDMHSSTRHPRGQLGKHDEWARPQSSQSAAAAMWALLRGYAAVVVRSTSGTRGR